MTEPVALEAIVLVLVAAGGLAVVLQRNPLHQAMASGAFGMTLALLFLLFHAPDVALSEIVVGSFVIPTLVLVAVGKVR